MHFMRNCLVNRRTFSLGNIPATQQNKKAVPALAGTALSCLDSGRQTLGSQVNPAMRQKRTASQARLVPVASRQAPYAFLLLFQCFCQYRNNLFLTGNDAFQCCRIVHEGHIECSTCAFRFFTKCQNDRIVVQNVCHNE